MNQNPIGIFDSGIGGLTVTKAIIETLPNENLIYLGDTARVPYGSRDKDIITQFALELTNFLLKQNVKALVVACNTISATCLDQIQKVSPVPVIGVITSTVKKALQTSQTHRLGVIATRATINSKIYEKELIKYYFSDTNEPPKIFSKACPLFVPLAEEGFINHPATKLIAQEYLSDLKSQNIDTLILGCTHYPILQNSIQEAIGEHIKLIDSAHPTAEALKNLLEEKKLTNNEANPNYKFYVTDAPEQVNQTATLFFQNNFPGQLEKITLT